MDWKSETSKFCQCGWLERAAAEPSNPIEFDDELNEYHLTYGRHYAILRFCPCCGCRAPESRRESFFEVVTTSEMERLQELVKSIKTLDDARRILGEPDEVIEPGGSSGSPGSGREPPQITLYGKAFRWLHLSKTAVVSVQVPPLDQVSVALYAKHKGPSVDRPA